MKKILFTTLYISSLSFGQIALVKDIFTGNNIYNSPQGLINYNGLIYFIMNDGNSTELWKSDGTSAGTMMAFDLTPMQPSYSTFGNTWNRIVFKNELYFSAGSDAIGGSELYKYDGQNVSLVKDINTNIPNSFFPFLTETSNPSQFFVLDNNTMFFTANDGTTGQELWKTDGTSAGTMLVKDFPNTNNVIEVMVKMNNKLYYTQITSTEGRELFVSDGTSEGTSIVKDIFPGATDGIWSNSKLFVSSNNSLYFGADDSVSNLKEELWKSDGTIAGTVLVKDINPGFVGSLPQRFVELNGTIYFHARMTNTGVELFKTDGTLAGTQLVADIYPGTTGSNHQNMRVVGNEIYLWARPDNLGYDLYKFDGTTLTKVYDFNTQSTDIIEDPNYRYIKYGSKIFFALNGKLWVTNGTSAGTVKAIDMFPGSEDPNGVSELTLIGDKLFFKGSSDNFNYVIPYTGNELYVLNLSSILTIEKMEANTNFAIYPNPSTGIVNINNKSNQAIGTIEVFDLFGKKVLEKNTSEAQTTISLSKGTYITTFKNGKGEAKQKIIIN